VRRALLLMLLASCGRFGFGSDSDGKPRGDGGSGADAVDAPDAAVVPFVKYWTSGTRIRARVFVVGDGSDPIWYGWHDTMTNTDCQNAYASDGMEHCMPVHARADAYFADGTCSTRLAWTLGQCNTDSYAFFTTGSNVVHAVPITTPYTGQVYDSSCQPTSPPGNGALYSVGAEVSPSIFAQEHYTTTKVGNYLHLYSGWNDGSSIDLGGLTFNSSSCNPTGGMISGTTGCRPNESVLVPVFSDGGCTQRAFYSSAGDTPTEFVVDNVSLCGQSFQVYSVVANVTAANYWTLGPAGCSMQTTGSGTLFTGTAVDPYPHGVLSVTTPVGRISYLTWTADDGVAMAIAEYDNTLGRTCRPFIAEDGIVRCLPRAPRSSNVSHDGSCATTPAATSADCYGNDPVGGVTYGSCDDGPWPVHTLAAIPAASYRDEATCRALGSAFDPASNTGTIPASTFAALTYMIE